jgi:hypothetical protein
MGMMGNKVTRSLPCEVANQKMRPGLFEGIADSATGIINQADAKVFRSGHGRIWVNLPPHNGQVLLQCGAWPKRSGTLKLTCKVDDTHGVVTAKRHEASERSQDRQDNKQQGVKQSFGNGKTSQPRGCKIAFPDQSKQSSRSQSLKMGHAKESSICRV